MNHAFDPVEVPRHLMLPKDRFDLLLGEAENTLFMIEQHLRPGMRLLEVGGGVGLVYALLRSMGYDIVSLEPGAEGFGDRHWAGLRLLEILEIDSIGWLRTGVEEFSMGDTDQKYDLIFSYFVLEHIPDLDRAFQVMAKAVSTDGLMIHRCPNYKVPFEPHYNIPLVPFRQEWTSLIFPGLKKRGGWRGLNFTTSGNIAELCASNGFHPTFRKGMMAWAFERVLTDPVFASRKKGVVRLARLLNSTGVIEVLRSLPVSMNTPMEFEAKKTDGSCPKLSDSRSR